MPSALLFILLGVMWAVVLVPMWLRKHDEANESRSVDRFSRALRSLSSGRQGGDEAQDAYDTVVVESRGKVPAPRDVMMPGRPAAAQGARVTVSGPIRPRGRRAASAATRRRRLVLGLLLVAAALLAGGLLHRTPVWLVAVPLVVVALVLVSARRQAARRAEMARRRRTRESLGAAARLAQAEHDRQAPARRGSRRIMPGPGENGADAVDVGFDEVSEGAGLDDGAWHAVPTTLPTYVTAPAATAVPRVIDRATPGGLSGAAMVEQARRTRHAEADDSGMRVESFEISVSRPADRHAADYAEQYVDTSAGSAELDGLVADDEDAISALVEDPRTGTGRVGYRRAAG